jgi:hypothetical protein
MTPSEVHQHRATGFPEACFHLRSEMSNSFVDIALKSPRSYLPRIRIVNLLHLVPYEYGLNISSEESSASKWLLDNGERSQADTSFGKEAEHNYSLLLEKYSWCCLLLDALLVASGEVGLKVFRSQEYCVFFHIYFQRSAFQQLKK